MSKRSFARAAAALVGLFALRGCAESGLLDPNRYPALAPYVDIAQRSACADQVDRLYWIDRRLVFWQRAGTCPDASWFDALYEGTSLEALCTAGDRIGGKQQACRVPMSAPLFRTIEAHSTEVDLGLGPGHTVEQVAIFR